MGAAANAIAAGEIVSWHAMSADEAVNRLATSREKGLDAAEATTRLQKHGPNRLPEGKMRGPFMRFLAVVVLNGLLGFIQEGKAEKALDSIRNMLSAETRMMRKRHGRAI
jgi:magnesium-transporting ATPase (P-type)